MKYLNPFNPLILVTFSALQSKNYKRIWFWSLDQTLIMAFFCRFYYVIQGNKCPWGKRFLSEHLVKLTQKVVTDTRASPSWFLCCNYCWSFLCCNYWRSLTLWNSTSWSGLKLNDKRQFVLHSHDSILVNNHNMTICFAILHLLWEGFSKLPSYAVTNHFSKMDYSFYVWPLPGVFQNSKFVRPTCASDINY